MGMPQLRRAPPLPPPGAERRKADRIELYAQVELRRQNEVTILTVVNVSEGGLLMMNDDVELDLGESVAVFLDANGVSFTMQATVVRCNATDLAVKWTSPDREALMQLLESLR